MNIDLKGKHALVGGASRGIGRAAAQELAALGANVTLMARNADKLREVKDGLALAPHQHHHIFPADSTDIAGLEKLMQAHLTLAGPIHILVNNTGGPPAGPVTQATIEQFERAFTQHLLCNHTLALAVLPGMKAEKYGRIINVISTSVKIPIKGLGVSNTIRGAVASWAKTLSMEVAPFGITVNNILPGATDTDRMQEIMEGKAIKSGKSMQEIEEHEKSAIPMGRFGQPEELGQAIAFLASPAASYITGVSLAVDGGRTGAL